MASDWTVGALFDYSTDHPTLTSSGKSAGTLDQYPTQPGNVRISAGGWVQFVFASPHRFAEAIVYHYKGTAHLTKGRIQAYVGGSWVTVSTHGNTTHSLSDIAHSADHLWTFTDLSQESTTWRFLVDSGSSSSRGWIMNIRWYLSESAGGPTSQSLILL